jgi:hypothetical protein
MPLRNIGRTSSTRRDTFGVLLRGAVRAVAPALALGVAGLTVACADGANGPTAPHSASDRAPAAGSTTSGSNLVSMTALLRTTPLAAPITRSVTLTGTGGTLQIPEAGLLITIPRGAVGDSTLRITATARPGSLVAYDFQPHGARFLTQLKIKQELTGTTWQDNTGTIRVGAGYYADPAQLDDPTGSAGVNEEIAGTISGRTFQFNVGHFSGYIMTTGRKRGGPPPRSCAAPRAAPPRCWPSLPPRWRGPAPTARPGPRPAAPRSARPPPCRRRA